MLDGDDLFVGDGGGTGVAGSLTELNASTGAFVRAFVGPAFFGPDVLALDGDDLFVQNGPVVGHHGSLTELNASTGAVVRIVSGARYQVGGVPMVVDRNNLLVGDGGSLVKLNA